MRGHQHSLVRACALEGVGPERGPEGTCSSRAAHLERDDIVALARDERDSQRPEGAGGIANATLARVPQVAWESGADLQVGLQLGPLVWRLLAVAASGGAVDSEALEDGDVALAQCATAALGECDAGAVGC
eukprot:6210366-Pleurochrysis_carterae.AAC.2